MHSGADENLVIVPTRQPQTVRRPVDTGSSLLEVLIAVVLLGLSIAGTLTMLSTTINATALDRDHANAHAWLQTAADVLYARDNEECLTAPTASLADQEADIDRIKGLYETTIEQTNNPEGWPAENIDIVELQLWHSKVDAPTEGWGTQCTGGDASLQRLVIEVRSETDEIIEQVEVILGG